MSSGRGDLVGPPHQQVRPAAVGYAVVDAVDGVVRLVLEGGEDISVARDQFHIDWLDVASLDEPQTGIAGRRDDIELLGVGGEQAERLVRGPEHLDRGLAAGRILERRDPVDGRVGRAVLGVAGPGEDRQRSLTLADRRRQARRGRAAAAAVLQAARTIAIVPSAPAIRCSLMLLLHPRRRAARSPARHRRRGSCAVASRRGGQPCL